MHVGSKYLLAGILISVQLICLLLIGINLYKKQKSLLGIHTQPSITYIKREGITFSQVDNLKYYYEPKSGAKEVYDIPERLNFTPSYIINSDTLNERFDYAVEKMQDTYRVITLGDSFTFGLYVDTKDNWTEILEDQLNSDLRCKDINKFEVINLGVPGYDIEYEVERFKLRGQKYNPDLVIWFLNQTDFNRINELVLPRLEFYISKGQPTRDNTAQVSYEADRKTQEDITREYSREKLNQYSLEKLNSIRRFYNQKLLIFVAKSFISSEDRSLIEQFIKSTDNISYFESDLDLVNLQKTVAPTDTHPNKDGHILLADAIRSYLIQSILKCP